MIRRNYGLPCALALLLACGPDSPNKDCEGAAAGAACSPDGQVCDPGADLCSEHAALACKDGSWQEQVVAAIECDTGTPTTGLGTDAGTGTSTATTGSEVVPCGASLPPEGSGCAVEGEDCSPGASDCEPYTGALCTGGAWMYYEVGPGDPNVCDEPVACDPQDIPPEGSACDMEGQTCSPGCEDPCMFCNVVRCEGGTWQGLEVFPADCPSCDTICPFVVAAGCSKGPVEQADCVAGCEATEAGDCQIPFHQTLACAGSQPTFSCDAMGNPIVAGCEPQFDKFYMCAGL